jgi:chromate reductase, NAD(P)H dehydrogenase (quinone)
LLNPRILVVPGSTRAGAISARVADAAAKALALNGAEVTRASLADFPLPLLDQDLERERGVPDNAVRLARLLALQDGFLIASPEYNHSIPPLVKNAIDWLSRVRTDGAKPLKPFAGKVAALCSSSNGGFAGVRCLAHLRPVLVACGVEVISPQCSIARGGEAFDEAGELREERYRRQMDRVAQALCLHAKLFSQRIEP